MRPREWNSQKFNYSLPEIDVISASRSLEIALEGMLYHEGEKKTRRTVASKVEFPKYQVFGCQNGHYLVTREPLKTQ